MTTSPSSLAGEGAKRVTLDEMSTWPRLSPDAPKANDDRTKRLCQAVEMYANGQSPTAAALHACVGERWFLRLIRRCRELAEDGRARGFRALVARASRDKRVRVAPLNLNPKYPGAGFAGMFGLFLRDHPTIEEATIKAIRRAGKDRLSPNRMYLRTAHLIFLKACREGGIKDDEYPLCTSSGARKAFGVCLRGDFMSRYAADWFAKELSPEAAQVARYASGSGDDTRMRPPYSVWMIDEITHDALTRVEIPNATGDYDEVETDRVQLIRCVVGYAGGLTAAWQFVVARQASADDLLMLMWNAVSGQPPARAVIESLHYAPGAGYPAVVIEELRWALPTVIYLDRALAHLCHRFQMLIQRRFGSEVRIGAPRVPQERAEEEAAYRKQVNQLTHQLPAATGSTPRSGLRRRSAARATVKLDIAEAEHVTDTYLANGNAMPQAGSGYVAPLERLRRQLKSGTLQPVYLPVAMRRIHLFTPPKEVTVLVDAKRGRTPYVNFMGCRYSSDVLRTSYGLVGDKFDARYDPQDLRVIWLYDPQTGQEWGTVRALGKWSRAPHDARLRKLYLRLKNDAEFAEQPQDDPLERIYAHLRTMSKSDRRSATWLGYLMRYLQSREDLAGQAGHALAAWEATQAALHEVGTLPLTPRRLGFDGASASGPREGGGDAADVDSPDIAELPDVGRTQPARNAVPRNVPRNAETRGAVASAIVDEGFLSFVAVRRARPVD